MAFLFRGVLFVIGFLAGLFTVEPGTVAPPNTSHDDGKNEGDQSGGQPAAQSGDGKKADDKLFTQAQLDEFLKQRLAQEKTQNEARATAAQRKAAEDALKQNQEWQTLAEQRGAELEQAKTQAERATVYADRLNTLIEGEIKGWPKEVTALDPGKDRLEDRLSWIEQARPLAAKLASLPTPPRTEAGQRNSAAPGANASGGAQPGREQPSAKYTFQGPNDLKW